MDECTPISGRVELLEVPNGTVVLQGDGAWVSADILIDVDAETIKEVIVKEPSPDVRKAEYFLIPGFIDTHVHLAAVTADLAGLTRKHQSYVACAALAEAKASLRRGFTTVRDAGGADHGVAAAAADGLLGVCPRILFAGRALSQTGGHADWRGPGQQCACACIDGSGLGRVCDGEAECRKAARDELRKGAHAIKIMAGGGVSSPTDKLEDLQFSEGEISAIVDEAKRKGTYVFAHAYTAEAIRRCVKLGVKSIEHGNVLDEAAAKEMSKAGAFLSQTNITYVALKEEGGSGGMPASMLQKVGKLAEQGRAAIALAKEHGVQITYGSDLLGKARRRQLEGFGQLLDSGLTPAEALASATSVGAALVGLEAGTIAAGKLADLCLLRVNPLEAPMLRALKEVDIARVWVGGKRGSMFH